MKRIELPLYLKLSSIYNKILQLTIAIVLILIIFNISLISNQKSNDDIYQHYLNISQLQLQQLADSALVFTQNSDRKSLDMLAKQVASQPFIEDVVFYDVTGLQMVSSNEVQSVKNRTITQLTNKTEESSPISYNTKQSVFMAEIRGDKLYGYVRMTLNDQQIIKPLYSVNQALFEQSHLLLILAGLVGFLLAKSFSKRSFPLAQVSK